MKLIIAYIRPEKLDDLKKELDKREVFRMSVMRANGCGEGKGYVESYRGSKKEIRLLPKLRVEIAVNEDFVDKTIDGIMAATKTGNLGDGKVFLVPLEECMRIRTGEKGPDAIGGFSKHLSKKKKSGQ